MADGPRGVSDVDLLSEAFKGETVSHSPMHTHQDTAGVPMPPLRDCVGQAVSQGEPCAGLNTFRGHLGSLCHARLHAIPRGFEEQQHQEIEGEWKEPLSKGAERERGREERTGSHSRGCGGPACLQRDAKTSRLLGKPTKERPGTFGHWDVVGSFFKWKLAKGLNFASVLIPDKTEAETGSRRD